MFDADVIVVGSGTMGSMAQWRLASRGADVIGIEQFEPGHDRGSGHGESRIIRTAYFEGADYVPLVRSAFELWRELEGETDEDLLTMTGGLVVGDPGSEVVVGAIQSAEEHGLRYERLEAEEVVSRFPQHRLRGNEVAVYEPDAGFLRPERAIRAAARRAEELGVRLLRDTVVQDMREVSDGVEVTAGDRIYRARQVVVAAGAWTGGLMSQLRLPLKVERRILCWFDALEPERFDPERFPICIHQERDGSSWYVFPTLDGKTVKAAVHSDTSVDPPPESPDALDREVHPEDTSRLERWIEETLPDLNPVSTRSQVCMYTNTPDEHFLVGRVPRYERTVLLAGYSGHGFKFASVMGEIAADFILEGGTSHRIEQFSPKRFVK